MITYIDNVDIRNKTVLLRVDFNVSLNSDHTIRDDARIKQVLPTLTYLLKRHNTLRILSHLGRPKGIAPAFSLQPVVTQLQTYLPDYKVVLIQDYIHAQQLPHQQPHEIFVLENVRFYEEEQKNDAVFAKSLARLADVYVNDAFAVCHRHDASVVGITRFIPSYGGLLLQKEITMLTRLLDHPKQPFVAIIGGSKIATKLKLLSKMTELAAYLLLGGGLAHNFLKAKGFEIGQSLYDAQLAQTVKNVLAQAVRHNTKIVLPEDVSIQSVSGEILVKSVSTVLPTDTIYDIGPKTQNRFADIIQKAQTLVWNGPVGYFENAAFRNGTDSLYRAILQNPNAFSVVGGGETIAAVEQNKHLEHISHISTGGGAMLAYIEQGTLPGIEALKKTQQ